MDKTFSGADHKMPLNGARPDEDNISLTQRTLRRESFKTSRCHIFANRPFGPAPDRIAIGHIAGKARRGQALRGKSNAIQPGL
jgi:hypothetical protein